MKRLIPIFALIILMGAGCDKPAAPSPTASTNPLTAASVTPEPASAGDVTVTETESGFSPASITVKKGTTVTFVNGADDDMWPASDPHPAHTAYPDGGGCRSSAFDACKPIAPGGTYSYTFEKAGAWKFHDHRNPSRRGVITVTE